MNITRFGNKSVISEVRKDEDRPYTDDGRRVDLLLHLLAIVNRTTSMPLMEIMINDFSFQIRNKMKEMNDYEKASKLLFDYIYELNEKEYEKVTKIYNKMTEEEKKAFIDETIENGIYIQEYGLWETKPLFYRINDVLKKYPWLHPQTIYINKFGRKIKTMSKIWVGEMYCLKLKQSDKKGFSARSTGAINTKELPTRSFKSKSHQDAHSETCIRFKPLNLYIVIYRTNLMKCWELLYGQSAAKNYL